MQKSDNESSKENPKSKNSSSDEMVPEEENEDENMEMFDDLDLEEEIFNADDQNSELTEEYKVIDVSNFFNYQKAISSLMDYLNLSIDDTISGFTRSDQLLFTHPKKKLIMNSILESGFYDFCKYRLAKVAKSTAMASKEKFAELMDKVQGEIDLLAYLLVNARLAHRNLNFDLFLSLLKGGLFIDVLETHEKIVKNMHEQEKSVNRENIKDNVKISSEQYYI